jgi:hypothetical protein
MTNKLTDRERILTKVIDGLRSTAILRARADPYSEASYANGSGGHYVHFAVYRKPVKGDLVIGTTGRDSYWKIAFYEECADPSNELHVVRSIDTGQLCNYGNETFTPIVGLHHTDTLTGKERAMFEKVMAAFARGDEYLYRYGGFRLDGDTAIITVREAHGGFGMESIPFSIEMKWTPKTTIKQILECMRAGGYGTKSFRPQDAQPNNTDPRP